MTEWDVFWRFMGQLTIVFIFVIVAYGSLLEIRKNYKNDDKKD